MDQKYLPWQAPPLPLCGALKPWQGLYAVFFFHTSRNFDRYHHLIEHWARIGCFRKSGGSPNRPTFTGKDDFIFISSRHKGGRRIRIGDMVSIIGLEVEDESAEITAL